MRKREEKNNYFRFYFCFTFLTDISLEAPEEKSAHPNTYGGWRRRWVVRTTSRICSYTSCRNSINCLLHHATVVILYFGQSEGSIRATTRLLVLLVQHFATKYIENFIARWKEINPHNQAGWMDKKNTS